MDEKKDIPYIVHEGAMARMERSNRRLLIALAISMVVMLLNNIAWLVYDHASQNITQEYTMFLSNQNNTNVLTAVQGFNAVNQNIAGGFADVRQGLATLGAQMNECLKKILLAIRNLLAFKAVDTYA